MLASSNGMLSLGLGLAFPGAGFWPWVLDDGGALCLGLPAWITYLAASLLSLAVFSLALVWWFGAGNVLAPPIVWLGAALIAAFSPPTAANASILVLLGPTLAWALLIGVCMAFRPKAAGAAGQVPPYPARAAEFSEAPPSDTVTTGLLRFALDRALQPVHEFEGFQFVDQFQTAATRYQIAQTGYALTLAQAQSPDTDELAQAMGNLIEKQTQHRIWRYWAWENAWGNLSTNPDPIGRDNIMYTGFLAAQIALYQRLTGDTRFSQPGSLILRHPKGMTYAADLPVLVETMQRGWDASPYGLMPCEPNWIYPLCNAIGACAVQSANPNGWENRKEVFQTALKTEFLDRDGLIVPFKSAHTGFAGPRVGGAVVASYPVLFWNALFPDIAAQLWGRVREMSLGPEGLRRDLFWKVDTGDYRFSRAACYAGFAAAAAEMGDQEARDAALAALEDECAAVDGPWHRPSASVFAHVTELMARLNPGGGFASLFAPDVDRPAPARNE